MAETRKPTAFTLRFRHKTGEWRHLEAHVTDLRSDRDIGGVVLNARDVTERVRLEEQLTEQAFHDSLTGLANRALFRDWIRWKYLSLLVEYKGRASDYFTAELETMFDWMKNKKRLTPQRVLGGKDAEFFIYPGAQHAFHGDHGPRYHPEAAELAWQRGTAFLDRHLKA